MLVREVLGLLLRPMLLFRNSDRVILSFYYQSRSCSLSGFAHLFCRPRQKLFKLHLQTLDLAFVLSLALLQNAVHVLLSRPGVVRVLLNRHVPFPIGVLDELQRFLLHGPHVSLGSFERLHKLRVLRRSFSPAPLGCGQCV